MLRLLARIVLFVLGWRIEGELPDLKKYVIIGAPHTSSIDGVVFIAGVAFLRVKLRFLAKQEIMDGPLGGVFRYFGAIGVERARANDLVQQLADDFARHEHFILALGPEGSRKYGSHWKSGFYHIARAADVPVLMIALHLPRRRIILGPTITLTGDVRADMDRIRTFYASRGAGKRPELVNPVRLREEDELEAASSASSASPAEAEDR